MATIIYPSNLPQDVSLGGNSARSKPAIIKSEIASGVTKRRLAGTFIPLEFAITVRMTPAELVIFENWRHTAEKYINPFQWKNPYTQKTGMFRILGAHSFVDIGGAIYDVSFKMETVPS